MFQSTISRIVHKANSNPQFFFITRYCISLSPNLVFTHSSTSLIKFNYTQNEYSWNDKQIKIDLAHSQRSFFILRNLCVSNSSVQRERKKFTIALSTPIISQDLKLFVPRFAMHLLDPHFHYNYLHTYLPYNAM